MILQRQLKKTQVHFRNSWHIELVCVNIYCLIGSSRDKSKLLRGMCGKPSVLLSTVRSCKQAESPYKSLKTAQQSQAQDGIAQHNIIQRKSNTSAQYNPGHHKTAQYYSNAV